MCLQYAQLETKLGELDRARGIYSHGSQFSDPRVSDSCFLKAVYDSLRQESNCN